MKVLGYVLAGVAGAVIGSVVTYLLMKKNTESFETVCTVDDIRNGMDEPEIIPTDLDKQLLENSAISKIYKPESECPSDESDIYLIDIDTIGDKYGDDTTVELMFYADGVLTDDDDVRIDFKDRLKYLGRIDLEHSFGDEDYIAVRNDILKCDFEVCRSTKTFDPVILEEDDIPWHEMR